MATQCPHAFKLRIDGMCKVCSELKPYMIFSTKTGYVWGPSHPLSGDRPYWMSDSKDSKDET